MSESIPKYILYSYWRSSCSWRVRISLNLKGIDYEYRAINLLKNEQNNVEYDKLNPSHKVPLLVLEDGRSIGQSLAIIDYLEQVHKTGKPLYPTDPFLRARALTFAESINADMQPLQNLPVLSQVTALGGDKAKQDWIQWMMKFGLTAADKLAREHGGLYCVGDSITVGDCCLVPQLYSARRFNIDLTPYTKLLEIEERLEKLPEFIKAHPDNQPDKPKDA